MSVTTTFANELLALVLEATPIANIADNASSGPLTSLYISLHTASPGVSGNQATNETAYTGYARVPVTRDSSGWTASSGDSDNDSDITFGQCTASPGSDLTHVGIGTSASGNGKLLYFGSLSNAPVVMQVGSTPLFSADNLDVICS